MYIYIYEYGSRIMINMHIFDTTLIMIALSFRCLFYLALCTPLATFKESIGR